MFTSENSDIVERHGLSRFKTWKEFTAEPDPFRSEKDIMDNQVCIIEYRNNVRVVFQATMCNVLPERRMYFSLTEGNIIAEVYSRRITYRSMYDDSTVTIDFGEANGNKGGHGGGDDILKYELFDSIYNELIPNAAEKKGLESAILALTLDNP